MFICRDCILWPDCSSSSAISVFWCLLSPSMDLHAVHRRHHSYGQKLRPGSGALRSQCSLILAGMQGPCFISQCRGMQCYIHLRCLGRADLTLPEEVGPYLCKWQRERGLIPPSPPSFIPRDTRALTVKPHLLFSSGFLHTPHHRIPRGFFEDGPNMLFLWHKGSECLFAIIMLKVTPFQSGSGNLTRRN